MNNQNFNNNMNNNQNYNNNPMNMNNQMNLNNVNNKEINIKKSFSMRGSIFHDFKSKPLFQDENPIFTVSEGLFEYAQLNNKPLVYFAYPKRVDARTVNKNQKI